MDRKDEVIKILAGLVSDLGTPISVLRDYESMTAFKDPIKASFRLGVYRLCINSIVINLNKYVELWRKYSDIKRTFLSAHDSSINLYISKINNLGVAGFRNDYAAHVQNNKIKKILTDEDVMAFVQNLTDGDAENLFSWIYPKNYLQLDRKDSLMGVVMLAKDTLLKHS